MERPALQGLLADIRAGRIDIVVIYKVDRLTRSLVDFARIVEIFDELTSTHLVQADPRSGFSPPRMETLVPARTGAHPGLCHQMRNALSRAPAGVGHPAP
jgi:hypothetical protein